MDHPDVRKMEQNGYVEKPNIFGYDFHGNEVYIGDEIYSYNFEFWLVEKLPKEAQDILEHFGAKKIRATHTEI